MFIWGQLPTLGQLIWILDFGSPLLRFRLRGTGSRTGFQAVSFGTVRKILALCKHPLLLLKSDKSGNNPLNPSIACLEDDPVNDQDHYKGLVFKFFNLVFIPGKGTSLCKQELCWTRLSIKSNFIMALDLSTILVWPNCISTDGVSIQMYNNLIYMEL